MLKKFLIALIFLFVFLGHGQITRKKPINDVRDPNVNFENYQKDSTAFDKVVKFKLSGKTVYTDYKIISSQNDTTFIDTTLTIKNDYINNFLGKDNFELLPFANQGRTFNTLAYNFSDVSLLPIFGARAKHFNFYEIDDIKYYHVPTPTTVLFYRTGIQQGQVLDALFTFNTSKRHNASFAFKGMRSLGLFKNSLSSHGNMRFTYSYKTKNEKYSLRSHMVAQDLINNENGGLSPISIDNFESNNPNFTDRGRLETNFTDASNVLRANRYYIKHDFKIWQRKDSLNNTKSYLKIGHIFNYELKHYEYRQTKANAIFGDAFTSKIDDKLLYKVVDNQAFISLKSSIILGELTFKANYFDYDYSYKSALTLNNQFIPSSLNGNTISVGGAWKTSLKKFNIHAETASIVTGDFKGNFFKTSAMFQQDSLFIFKGTFLTNSRSPNFNFIMNQSNYIGYNWLNDLKNQKTRSIIFDLQSKKLLNAHIQLSQIDNFSYFSDTTATQKQPIPKQLSGTINYLKVKVSREFKIGKFALDNTIMYQNVSQGSSVFRVPELVTRNTLYFSDYIFKGDPLFLQTGITFKYFSEYYANAYNPVLSEFNLQNEQKIGGYPVFDFFINAQIQRTRLYLKAEHFNSNFSSPNYYSAPNYPYRDYVVRFVS
jgi:hypothetical protein